MARVSLPPFLDSAPSAARVCLWFYLVMLFISLSYILTTGTYNGDFYGVPVTLSALATAALSAAAFAPYAFGFWLYLQFSRRGSAPTVRVSNAMLGITFFIVTIWFIVLVIKYDVGVLGKELYDAPATIKPFIQITNRINPFYLGAFFIAGYQGSKKTIALGIILMITLGVLRAGLGVFMYVLLALAIRNHRQLGNLLRRHFIKIVLIMLLLPTAVAQLYALRSELRDLENVDVALSATELITARLVGRLSSVSNSALVIQESTQFGFDTHKLDTFYFQKQALAPFFGVSLIPEVTPERMLINVYGGDFFDSSFMTGVPGNLLMAWLKNPLIAVLNAVTMVFFSWLTFFLGNKLGLPYRNEISFMLLLYPLTSGVSNEFSGLALSMLALAVLFTLLNIPLARRLAHRA